jgi:hypothetical protein
VPFHLAPDLEGRLPKSVGPKALTVESVVANGFKDAAGTHQIGVRCRWYEGRGLRCRDEKELATALGAIGKAAGDVAIAVAYNETKDQEVEVQATRVAGADAIADAAGVARAVYPARSRQTRPGAVVLVDVDDWRSAISAAQRRVPSAERGKGTR